MRHHRAAAQACRQLRSMVHYLLSCDRQRIRYRALPPGCERGAVIDGRPVAVHRGIQRLGKEATWPNEYAHVLACNVGNEPGTSTEKLSRSNFQVLSAKRAQRARALVDKALGEP